MSIEPIHVISLGAGVQSSTMALMAAHGEISPMPVAAVFADTQAEPASVYRWLDWLERQLPFPVIRTSLGNLEEIAATAKISRNGNTYTSGAVPAYIVDEETGKVGLLTRQCTYHFKIKMIERTAKLLRKRHARGKDFPDVRQWIGISLDEAHRMKPSRKDFIWNRWPLVELGLSRADCLDWMTAKGYPTPPRSSCVFCPYHSDREWAEMKETQPEEFARAVAFEGSFAAAVSQTRQKRGGTFLHKSCVPLDQVEFKIGSNEKQFGNECEGVCGV
jgi:hypothetical protein